MLPTEIKSRSILKHPDAIHVAAKKNGKFNLIHRKMLNTLSFLAKEDIEKFRNDGNVDEFLDKFDGQEVNHEANVTDFKTVLKFNSHETAYLRIVLLELMSTVLEFDVLRDENKRKFKAMPLLTNAEIEDGVVRWSYRSEVRRMFLAPDRYQMLDLEITNAFTRDAALALYENIVCYERLGRSPWFAKDDLRLLLGADGQSYSQFKIFNNRVLKPALKQIEEVSQVMFKPVVKKRGRRVAFIKFEIIRSKESDMFKSEDDNVVPDDQLRTCLQAIGFKDKQIGEFYEAYDLAYLEEKVIWLQQELCSNTSIKNPSAFAYAAIRDDYNTSSVDASTPIDTLLTTNGSSLVAHNGVGCHMYSFEVLQAYMLDGEVHRLKMSYQHIAATDNVNLSAKAIKEAFLGDVTKAGNPLFNGFWTYVRGHVFMNGDLSLDIKERIENRKDANALSHVVLPKVTSH